MGDSVAVFVPALSVTMGAEPSDNFRAVLTVAVVALYVGISGAYTEKCNNQSYSLRINLIRRESRLSPLRQYRRLSTTDLLRQAIERSNNRLQRYQSFITNATRYGHSKSYYSPVNSDDGEFLMQAAMGSPNPQNLNFIADTGSDLTWTQCLPCQSCFRQNYPLYDPSRSSDNKNISCFSNFCTVVSGNCDDLQNCYYTYGYADLSSTAGNLSFDTFTLPVAGTPNSARFPQIAFGCGRTQFGDFSNSTGIVGLGRGPISFVNQIRSHIDSTFSYCLGSIYNSTQVSPLFLGKGALDSSPRVIPLIYNLFFPTFYYLNLTGISVGGKPVPIPQGTFDIQFDGNGGVFIDSGTTLTYLQEQAYYPLLDALRSNIRGEPVDANAAIGLDFCYKSTPQLELPDITFYFDGNVPYTLPVQNAFLFAYQAPDELACLAMLSAGPAGSSGVLGNIQQQNFHITYDLANNKFSFSPKDCATM